eukprot:TRINITY_DN985_c0_g1_i1.p1 TRINITY_DN985_c0_g1~~TRINITY_DN985_c0_g1_i1.p1  ORF type:complete len:465 (+),score=123.98 TRINITY_DN985_c0_g1_i1:105-1499(+)
MPGRSSKRKAKKAAAEGPRRGGSVPFPFAPPGFAHPGFAHPGFGSRYSSDEDDYYEDDDDDDDDGFGFHDFLHHMMHHTGGFHGRGGDFDDEDSFESDDDDFRPQFCHRCGEDFASERDVEVHQKKAQHFYCSMCCIRFDSEKELDDHDERHGRDAVEDMVTDFYMEAEDALEDMVEEVAPISGHHTAVPFAAIAYWNYGIKAWKNEAVVSLFKRMIEQVEINLGHLKDQFDEIIEPSKQIDFIDILLNPKNPAKLCELYDKFHSECKKASLQMALQYQQSGSTTAPAAFMYANYTKKSMQFIKSGGSINDVLQKVDLGELRPWPAREYTDRFTKGRAEKPPRRVEEVPEKKKKKKKKNRNKKKKVAADQPGQQPTVPTQPTSQTTDGPSQPDLQQPQPTQPKQPTQAKQSEKPKKTSKCLCCGKPTNHRCDGCQKVFYCSMDCQKKNWGSHKKNCVKAPRKAT